MPKVHPNEGTFGGSDAAHVLDKILCEINNEALIRKIGKIVSWTYTTRERLIAGVADKGFRLHLIRDFRRTLIERIDALDWIEFMLPQGKMDIIKSYTKNVTWTILRQAQKSDLPTTFTPEQS